MTRGSFAGLAAAAACWSAAFGLWWGTGRVSAILLAGPLVVWAAASLASVRRARLEAQVAAAFSELISEDELRFDGARAEVLARRARLLGIAPPRLVELRLVRMPEGEHYAVRAETTGAAVAWRVQRLSPEQAQQWRSQMP